MNSNPRRTYSSQKWEDGARKIVDAVLPTGQPVEVVVRPAHRSRWAVGLGIVSICGVLTAPDFRNLGKVSAMLIGLGSTVEAAESIAERIATDVWDLQTSQKVNRVIGPEIPEHVPNEPIEIASEGGKGGWTLCLRSVQLPAVRGLLVEVKLLRGDDTVGVLQAHLLEFLRNPHYNGISITELVRATASAAVWLWRDDLAMIS